MKKLFFLMLAGAPLLLAAPAHATPYIPASGDTVIETLARRADPAQRELRRLRSRLSAAPRDLALATGLARRYIALGRADTDPRYLGYAQAALAPWWRLAAPPPEVRLLRATLLQGSHHFDAALADLDGVLAAAPNMAQAWLTRATVLTVQGEYAAATASCARLSKLANELVTIACIANVGALTGRLAKSEALLELGLRRGGAVDPELRLWVLTLLAEMASRRGDAALAEARFRDALALSPRDCYLQGAYADFLLDQDRPAQVIALLREQGRVDALLLRRALAWRRMPGGARELAADSAELAARFEAAALRGDTVHRREQARFELALRDNPRAALALARQNWALQREPADLRIYLEAALQAHEPAAAKPALDWMSAHRGEDAAALRLARQLKAGA
ncbi:putative Zn-dependent protease [Oxalobacteraceae bacterium GrIS 1.11]